MTSATGQTLSLVFTYNNPAEGGQAEAAYYSSNSGTTWQTPTGTFLYGANSLTVNNTTTITNTSTWWTVGVPKYYYSYQSGTWNTPNTWTSDPGGTTQVGTTIPGPNDIVVILSGRTVNLIAPVATVNDITINNGAYLDLSTFQFSSGMLALRGQGTLKLSSSGFPTPVTTNTFVNAGGGTTEYDASVNLSTQAAYNNLTINNNATVIQNNTPVLTINGNLNIMTGSTYQLNDNTAQRLQLLISGNVTVNTGAFFKVGYGVTNTITDPTTASIGGTAPFINYYDLQSHRVVINGDFTNNGTVKFTNLPFPEYNSFPPIIRDLTTGLASVYFQGATNNTLTCNGTTDFYNLILDKGIDQTYKLTIYCSAYSNFRLFGANNAAGEASGANANLRKALWIRTGTLDLTGLVVIPSLTEGSIAGPSDE